MSCDIRLRYIGRGTTFAGVSVAKFGHMRSFDRAVFENGLQYCHSDPKIFNGNMLATFCANMIKIGLVIPEILDGKNGYISLNISPTTGPIFTNV